MPRDRDQDDLVDYEEFEYGHLNDEEYYEDEDLDDYLYNEDTKDLNFDPEIGERYRRDDDGRPDPDYD